jgi:hypothetical protein
VQAALFQQTEEVGGVLIADKAPEGTVLGQNPMSGMHPLTAPPKVVLFRQLVGVVAIPVVNAEVVRRVGKDQPGASSGQQGHFLQAIAVNGSATGHGGHASSLLLG